MAQAELHLTFQGPAVAAGQMDARWVGQSLLAASDLLTHVKGADADLRDATVPRVSVASFDRGSFDINLLLEGLGDFWEQTRVLANGDDATAIVQIGTAVGFVVGAIRLFGKRKVRAHATDSTGDRVLVEFEDGEPRQALMSPETFQAFMNPQVRRAARRMIEPVERQGVDSVTISASAPRSRPAAETVTVTKADADNFVVEDPDPPAPSTTRRTVRVQPLSINFSSEAWRVSEGTGSFMAKVEDEAFLRQIDAGTARIGKTDIFEVGLRIEQTTETNGKLKVKYAIERIITQQPGETQPQLDVDKATEDDA